jgi:hypothetical protein
MFGHQGDKSSQPTVNDVPGDIEAADTQTIAADQPSGDPGQPAAAGTGIAPDTTLNPAPAALGTVAPADQAWQHPGTPIGDSSPAGPQSDQPADKDQIADVISPAGGFPKRPTFSSQAKVPELDDSVSDILKPKDLATGDTNRELMDIRQKALTELAPIIDKLDLPPLEKFRTIMMIIQISDDEAMVKAAYDAAHSITDEKDKAQALLDIVNEVNYFTHQPEPEN